MKVSAVMTVFSVRKDCVNLLVPARERSFERLHRCPSLSRACDLRFTVQAAALRGAALRTVHDEQEQQCMLERCFDGIRDATFLAPSLKGGEPPTPRNDSFVKRHEPRSHGPGCDSRSSKAELLEQGDFWYQIPDELPPYVKV
ncbi:hypothetical protein MTO96_041014 [Rhipicephalus appendiculatus]